MTFTIQRCLMRIVAALLLLSALLVSSEIFGVNVDGTGTTGKGLPPLPPKTTATNDDNKIDVTLYNSLDEDVSVIWYQGLQYAWILDVHAGETAVMHTFAGHHFYCVRKDDNQDTRFFDFTVHDYTDSLEIYDDSAVRHLGKSKDSTASPSSSMTAPPDIKAAVQQQRGDGRMHPRVKVIPQRSTSVGAKFKSLYPKALNIWYDDGGDGVPQGQLGPGKETTTNTYEGHIFYFTETGDKSRKRVATVKISAKKPFYTVRGSHTDEELRRLLPNGVFDLAMAEQAYIATYRERTGIDWRHFYGKDGPRAPPSLFMHPADYVGQTIKVQSPEGYWSCNRSAPECHSFTPVEMTLEVVSVAPRAYIIERFLSDYEADAIVAHAKTKVASSTVGNADGGGVRVSETRTSRNTWIPRTESPITETLFVRASHLLNVDEKLLTRDRNAEDLQVVHYKPGQKYDAHHDWGVNGYPESRYITLLLYLNDLPDTESGGETAFPKAGKDGATGIKVAPKRGSALLFYSLLPDGNGDDLSLHAALPVVKGEKWLANFWVWDPKKKP